MLNSLAAKYAQTVGKPADVQMRYLVDSKIKEVRQRSLASMGFQVVVVALVEVGYETIPPSCSDLPLVDTGPATELPFDLLSLHLLRSPDSYHELCHQ